MEHNSAKVAKELGFGYKYVLEDFYQSNKDTERTARDICEKYSAKSIDEILVLLKDVDIKSFKEEVIMRKAVEKEILKKKKQKLAGEYNTECLNCEEHVKQFEVLENKYNSLLDAHNTLLREKETDEKEAVKLRQKCDQNEKAMQEYFEELQCLTRVFNMVKKEQEEMESKLETFKTCARCDDKERSLMIHETERKMLLRAKELHEKEEYVWHAEKAELEYKLEKLQKENEKMLTENSILKSTIKQYFQQLN